MTTAFLFLVPAVPWAAFHLALPAMRLAEAARDDEAKAAARSHRHSGAPARPDAGSPLSSPFSGRAVREAARGWTWKRMETPGWKVLSAGRFVVRGDVPVGELRRCGAYLGEFLRMMEASLGGEAKDAAFAARVFADPDAFRLFAARRGAANAESFYDPRIAELVICLEPERGDDWLRRTLAHEFAHAYMDRVWDCRGPLWFAEGMAEYFSGFTVREGRAVPGAVDRRALLLLRLDGTMPLEKYFALGRGEMYGVGFAKLYAQAWSLVHYLAAEDPETIDLLLRGGRLAEVEELEGRWLKYLETVDSDQ